MAWHMTEAERVLWSRLRANRLQNLHFRRQVVIRGFIADFYCHAARLIIEVDGAVHETQVEHDVERERILTSIGYRILRFSNEDVLNNLGRTMLKILIACRDTGTDFSPHGHLT